MRVFAITLILGGFLTMASCVYRTASKADPVTQATDSTVFPTVLFPQREWDADLEAAWQRFTTDGHYRMAQPDDFHFTEKAVQKMGRELAEKYRTKPYKTWWGGTGVIVVDTRRTDRNRMGLVVFMEPDNHYNRTSRRSCEYRTVWLYKERDLSMTGLSQMSGYWFVDSYDKEGNVTSIDESRFGRLHRNHCG